TEYFQLVRQDFETTQPTLRSLRQVLGKFKTTYFDYKAKAAVECPSNPWRVQNNAVFARMDAFLERCHDVLDLTQTIAQFQKV
ncbi:unnamed protein product, partial [Laminaria digitata]